jgi:hypothetical protein
MSTTFLNNPFGPSFSTEIYTPDQLIVGGVNTVETDFGTLHGGAALIRGTVLGQTKFGTVTSTAVTGTGTETIGSMSAGVKAKVGNYLVTVTATSQTGAFSVKNPEGEMLATGLVGTPYVSNEINFTITAGGTVTAADYFTVTVPETTTPLYLASVATAVDGSQYPSAILADAADPSGGDVASIPVYLAGEFNANALTFDDSFTALEIKTLFRDKGIYIKAPVMAGTPDFH